MTVLFSFFVMIYLMNLFIVLLNNAIETYYKYASYLSQKAEVLQRSYYYVNTNTVCNSRVNNKAVPIGVGEDRVILSFPKSTKIRMVFQYHVGNLVCSSYF